MKLQLGYLAANVLADVSLLFVKFTFDDFDYNKPANYYSRVPVIEVYRYTDNTLVATLTRETTHKDTEKIGGFYTGLLTNYDRESMYFKIIAPTVRLTMTISLSFGI